MAEQEPKRWSNLDQWFYDADLEDREGQKDSCWFAECRICRTTTTHDRNGCCKCRGVPPKTDILVCTRDHCRAKGVKIHEDDVSMEFKGNPICNVCGWELQPWIDDHINR